MKNLENYGVQVLNAKEIKETDGGTEWWQRISPDLGLGVDIAEYIIAKYRQGCACN